jgi:thiol:disulfide interchange protein DsbA
VKKRYTEEVSIFMRLAIIAFAFLTLAGFARASAVAGHDYVVLDVPQRQESKGKIEVIEFFSWGCPHCYDFYPLLGQWVARLPKDVIFKRIPVGLGHPEWDTLVRTYYALQTTGDLARLDTAIYEAIHQEHVALFDEKSIAAWVGQHGVNVAAFTQAFHSFDVETSVGRSEQTAIDYRAGGIPTIAIGGRYTVTGEPAKILAVADELIAKTRAEDGKPKK